MLARLVDQVLDGNDAVVVGPGDSAPFLRDVVLRLKDRGCCVLHVTAAVPESLGLSALLAQVAGQPDLGAHDDDTLERGFQRLTVPSPGCDRIVLVIDGADRLHDAVFRYLALASKAADELQFVLAGQTDPTTRTSEVAALLHARLTAQPAFQIEPLLAGLPRPPPPATVLAGSMRDDALFLEGASAPATGQDGRKQRAVWIAAGLGMALSAVVGFGAGWQVRSGYRMGAEAPAASARIDPASSPDHVGAAPITPVPNSGSPVPDAAVALPAPAPAPSPLVPPVNVERGLDPSSAAPLTAPPDPKPAFAEPPLPPSPPETAAAPEPGVQAGPAEPHQPSPTADAPSAIPLPAAPAHPAVPPALPRPRNAEQDRQPQAVIPAPRVRSAAPSASRTRPSPDTGERWPHEQSKRPSETAVQGFSPQGANPSGNRPVIGSFVVGPDGTRVFRPNP